MWVGLLCVVSELLQWLSPGSGWNIPCGLKWASEYVCEYVCLAVQKDLAWGCPD